MRIKKNPLPSCHVFRIKNIHSPPRLNFFNATGLQLNSISRFRFSVLPEISKIGNSIFLDIRVFSASLTPVSNSHQNLCQYRVTCMVSYLRVGAIVSLFLIKFFSKSRVEVTFTILKFARGIPHG